MARDRKTYAIPKYLDGLPEVIIFPIDEFGVFLITFLLTFFFSTLLAVVIALLVSYLYHRAKKGKPRNYYLLLLYNFGLYKPKGVQSPVVKEFQE
jgi:type IV conjugative transfer system protein TraL